MSKFNKWLWGVILVVNIVILLLILIKEGVGFFMENPSMLIWAASIAGAIVGWRWITND